MENVFPGMQQATLVQWGAADQLPTFPKSHLLLLALYTALQNTNSSSS